MAPILFKKASSTAYEKFWRHLCSASERIDIRNTAKLFDIYGPELKTSNYQAHKIFSVDETWITAVQQSHSKTVSVRRKKEVECLTSAEKVNLITVATCMNATGKYIPQLIVFPRKNKKEERMDGTPVDLISACHPNCWTENCLSLRLMILFCRLFMVYIYTPRMYI